MYELLNVFDIFLPQLLTYPNASDPLNGEAATMWSKDRKMFEAKVNGRLLTDNGSLSRAALIELNMLRIHRPLRHLSSSQQGFV